MRAFAEKYNIASHGGVSRAADPDRLPTRDIEGEHIVGLLGRLAVLAMTGWLDCSEIPIEGPQASKLM